MLSRLASQAFCAGRRGSNVALFVSSGSFVGECHHLDSALIRSPLCFSSEAADAVSKVRAKRKSKAINAAWNTYLETGEGAGGIFRMIDFSGNHQISALELQLFVDSVEQKGVSPEGLVLLKNLAQENKDGNMNEMDETEFVQWLNIATNPPTPQADAVPAPEANSSPGHDGVMKLRAKRKSKLMNLVWDRYLENNVDACEVFKVIDLNRNFRISVKELIIFLDSVNLKGVQSGTIQELKEKGEDDEMDFEEFHQWISSL